MPASQTTKELQIVDCLLPDQSTLQSQTTPHKLAEKITAAECQARQGQYVSSDKANYSTALKVWEPLALRGDAQAQYYVGEIHEKGMGREPNSHLAAIWYIRAAKNGYIPAQMTIGRMYEVGNGVEKNLTKAMTWYQKASGLSDEKLEYQSAFTDKNAENESIQPEIAKQKKNLDQINKQLTQAHKELEESELLAEKLNRDMRRINIRIKRVSSPIKRNSTLIKRNSVPIKGIKIPQKKIPDKKSIKVELVKDELELESQESLNVALKTELSLAKANVTTESYLQEKVTKAQVALEGERTSVLEFKDRLTAVNQALSETPADQQLQIYQDYLENELKIIVENNHADTNQQTLIRRLIDEIKQRKPSVEKSSDTLSEKNGFYKSQLAILNTNLSEKEKSLAVLSDRLKSAQQKSADRNAYIKQLEKQVSESQKKLVEQQDQVIDKQKKLSAAQVEIASLNESVEKSLPKADIDKLKGELKQKEKDLILAKTQSEKLVGELKKLEQRKNELADKVSGLIPDKTPVIAVRWPEYEKVGEVYKSVVAAGSVVNIVGAVYPHQFIQDLTINMEAEELDQNGLFLNSVEVGNDPVFLEIIATNSEGKSSKELLLLEPDAQLTAQHAVFKSDALPDVEFGKYYALVIGNSQYDENLGWDKLDTTVNDAQAISKLLAENYGFEVTTKIDADRDALLFALETIRRKLTEKDNLLIYYAGHGYVDPENDQGYWIPVDGSVDSSIKWISNSTITDQIRAMTARNVMVIADSCYSSALMRSGVVSLRSGLSLHKKLERLSNDIRAITRVALSAGGLQPVADSIDDSGHSVFANAFLKVLAENQSILDGDSIATQVGFMVSTATQDNIKQVPRYAPLARGGHQGGEFYFVPKDWKRSDI